MSVGEHLAAGGTLAGEATCVFLLELVTTCV